MAPTGPRSEPGAAASHRARIAAPLGSGRSSASSSRTRRGSSPPPSLDVTSMRGASDRAAVSAAPSATPSSTIRSMTSPVEVRVSVASLYSSLAWMITSHSPGRPSRLGLVHTDSTPTAGPSDSTFESNDRETPTSPATTSSTVVPTVSTSTPIRLFRSACRSLTMSSTARSSATASSGAEATVRPPGRPGISVRVCGSRVVHDQRHASAASHSTTTARSAGRVERGRLHDQPAGQRGDALGLPRGAEHPDAPQVDLDRDRPVDLVLLAEQVDARRQVVGRERVLAAAELDRRRQVGRPDPHGHEVRVRRSALPELGQVEARPVEEADGVGRGGAAGGDQVVVHGPQLVDDEDWRTELAAALQAKGASRLVSASGATPALARAIRELMVDPLEVNWLHVHPQLEGITREGGRYSVSLSLREAPQ